MDGNSLPGDLASAAHRTKDLERPTGRVLEGCVLQARMRVTHALWTRTGSFRGKRDFPQDWCVVHAGAHARLVHVCASSIVSRPTQDHKGLWKTHGRGMVACLGLQSLATRQEEKAWCRCSACTAARRASGAQCRSPPSAHACPDPSGEN